MKLFLPNGRRVLSLPEADSLRFSDGRTLKRRGRYEQAGASGWVYRSCDRLAVLASVDHTPNHGPLLHVSLSYADRDPPWATIRQVRAMFFPPDVDVMMMLPQERDYVAGVPGWEDSHVFHLWETPSEWAIQ